MAGTSFAGVNCGVGVQLVKADLCLPALFRVSSRDRGVFCRGKRGVFLVTPSGGSLLLSSNRRRVVADR